MRKFFLTNWPLFLILLVGAVFRFWRLEALTTFGGDQGYDFENIRQILQGNLTLLGPKIGPYTNVATLYLGPLYYYLMAPFLFLTRLDPIGISYAMVIARLLTTLLIYIATKKLLGIETALIVAIISALSPYWINQLGFPSNVYLVPPLVAVSLILIQTVSKGKNSLTFFVLGLIASSIIHFHYLAVVLMPSLVIYFWIQRDILNVRKIVALVCGFFLGLLPIFVFEMRNEFFLTNQLFKLIKSGSVLSTFTMISKSQENSQFIAQNILGISSWFVGISLIIFAAFKLNSKKKPIPVFLATIIIVNFLIAVFYFGPVQPHYLATAYVPLFIFTAHLISKSRIFHKSFPILLTLIISIFLINKNHLLSPQGYTMPQDLTVKEIKKISKIVTSDVGSDTFNVTSTLDGDSRALPYRYLTKVYGKNPLDEETYDKGDSLYVITRDPPYVVPQNSLFEIASFQPSVVEKTWNITGNIRLVKLSKKDVSTPPPENFITIVNLVRNRKLWSDKDIASLIKQLNQVKNYNLPSTWLLQYDTLNDKEITDLFKSQNNLELGAFLEVSEDQATDAGVSYKVADGDYYRPDKIFLSGYSRLDRTKLINTYFNKFKKTFGFSPQSVGAWYIDATSQILLSKLGVTSGLVVADQYDTDAASSWGKYWGMPFYPSSLNSLEPAASQSQKIPIVNIQWAQRDPVEGYGREIFNSRHSFQANDYINNGFDTTYFENLLNIYLGNQSNEFAQITIGLESGQEALFFDKEFESQLQIVERLKISGKAKVTTMSHFASWYQNKYPGVSPSHFLQKDDSFWYMSPFFRLAIFKERDQYLLKDLHLYKGSAFKDYLYKDEKPYLDRKVPALIDQVHLGNQINLGPTHNLQVTENFDRLTIKLDNREMQIKPGGLFVDSRLVYSTDYQNHSARLKYLTTIQSAQQLSSQLLNHFKYSIIDGQKIVGVAIDRSNLIGFKDFSPGVYSFEFQPLSKFLTPATLIQKWQPWIN